VGGLIEHEVRDLQEKIRRNLLEKKIIGTVVKDAKGKKHSVCFECQKNLRTKEEILKKL